MDLEQLQRQSGKTPSVASASIGRNARASNPAHPDLSCAIAGNEGERNRNSSTSGEVRSRMDSGDSCTFRYSSSPRVREGDRVRLIDGGRSLALLRN